MPTDRVQNQFSVGDIVWVPITVTSLGGTTSQPTVTGTTQYVGFDGNNDTIGPVDAIQVIEAK